MPRKTGADVQFLGDDPAAWGLHEEHGRTYLTADRYAESLWLSGRASARR